MPAPGNTHLRRLRIITALTWYGYHLATAGRDLCLWLILATTTIALLGNLPADIRIPLAALFWLGTVITLHRGIARYRACPPIQIDRLLEHHAGLRHRPLDRISDHPANTTTDHPAWHAAQTQAQSDLARIRTTPFPAPPQKYIATITLALLPLLAIGVIISFTPYLNWTASLTPWTIKPTSTITAVPEYALTLTPPTYTRLPAIVRPGTAPTEPLALISGTTLHIEGNAKSTLSPLTLWGFGWPHIINGTYTASINGSGPSSFTLRSGITTREHLTYTILPDTPPTAELVGDPEGDSNGILTLHLNTQDDFGIETADIRIAGTQPVPIGSLLRDEYLRLPIDIPASAQPRATTLPLDLSASIWAGAPVTLTIDLRDHLGQAASLPRLTLTLPERLFRHPAPSLIAGIRRGLINEGMTARAPSFIALSAVLERPDVFGNDTLAVLALRIAAERIKYAKSDEDLRTAAHLLWQVALRLEDGGTDMREQLLSLQAARQNLQKLLADPNTTAAEIAEAMEKFQQSLAETLSAIAQRLQKQQGSERLTELMKQMPDMQTQTMDMNLLKEFMDQLKAEIAAGNHDKAREMLDQLQQMADNTARASAASAEQLEKLMDLIDRTQTLIAKQRALKTRTDTAANDEKPVTPLAPEQQSLADMLAAIKTDIEKSFPITPPNIGAAEQAMQNSKTALLENSSATSSAAQQAAIDALEDMQQSSSRQMMQMMQQMMIMGMPMGASPNQQGDEQKGQQGDNGQDTGSRNIKTPGTTRDAIRNILNTLRTRMGENRPKEERDYFERLLRQF